MERSGVGKPGACHLFRHTMATLMLEGGADIRFIQEMLGHADLNTTQLYTQVSIRKLREIHAATHPGARLARRPAAADRAAEKGAAGDPSPSVAAAARAADKGRRAMVAAELHSLLAAEAAADNEDD